MRLLQKVLGPRRSSSIYEIQQCSLNLEEQQCSQNSLGRSRYKYATETSQSPTWRGNPAGQWNPQKAEEEHKILADKSPNTDELSEAKLTIHLCTDKMRKNDKAERLARLTHDMDNKRRTRAERTGTSSESGKTSRGKNKPNRIFPRPAGATAVGDHHSARGTQVDQLSGDADEYDPVISINLELNRNSNNNNNDNDQTDHNSTVNQEDNNATYVTKTFVQRKFTINLNKLKQSRVLNLSNVTLSPTELVLLGKGLTFIPTSTPPDLGEINNDLAYIFGEWGWNFTSPIWNQSQTPQILRNI